MKSGSSRHAVMAVFCASILALSGCSDTVIASSKTEKGPVAIGRSANDLKGTPCACMEIPMEIPSAMKV